MCFSGESYYRTDFPRGTFRGYVGYATEKSVLPPLGYHRKYRNKFVHKEKLGATKRKKSTLLIYDSLLILLWMELLCSG